MVISNDGQSYDDPLHFTNDWKIHGRGCFQPTFKFQYLACEPLEKGY